MLPFARSVLVLLLLLVPVATQAQVRVSLVSAVNSVQPGQPLHVALRLEHESHWHTYWVEAGTGYPTSITWNLPPGWVAGPILWPTPQVVRGVDGSIAGNGFEGVVHLPVVLTPPGDLAPGTTVTLKATADWLMCKEMCMPGQAEVALRLPVRAEKPAAEPVHGEAVERAFAALPRDVPDLTVAATREGTAILLQIRRKSGAAAPLPGSLWFFAEDAFVQYDKPQVERSRDEMTVLLALPVSETYAGAGRRLVGVLRTEGSWTIVGEPLPGLRIDVALGDGAAALAAGTGIAGADGPTTGGASGSLSIMATLVFAFAGGLILNLMPCVFPVLGIKIMGFVQQAGSDRRKVARHGLVFSAGVVASFWTLAAILATLRAGGDQLGWGFQLQSPAFVFALAAVMLAFGLVMSGVFEVGLGATGVGANLQTREGYTGSFFTGVLATVVATPCSAPFLAPALGVALALPVATSFLVFTAIALGLSLPYLLLSLFPGAIRVLPRPGAWMETFKQFMAFPLYATVAYLVWVLAGQVDESSFLTLLFGMTLLAMGLWFYGHYRAPGASVGRARLGLVGGIALVIGGLALGWPRAAAPTDIEWQDWSPEAVAAGVAAGRPVYVDFTARWCATCQTNKRVVFSSGEVKRLFRERNVLTLRADWTRRDPRITAALAEWNRSAVPFNLVYQPGSPEPVPLPELLTPGIVLDAFRSTP
jgi:thiol:disulfide interchange protein/DsbC/DsbD-like thiol-disulfide interchange protein